MLFRKNIYFNNPDVADLAWAMGSPPLMSEDAAMGKYILLSEEWFDEQFDLHLEWLRELDKNPAPLNEWLVNDAQKLLGKRFESLLGFWFSNSPHFELLYRNMVLHHHQNTTGEIDFLIRENSSGNILHIETACKYYLGERKSSSWKNWIGPNGHDSLDLKMKKAQKQMSVFDREEGKALLKKEGLQKPVSCFFLKGYFFHHYSRIAGAVPPLHAHHHYNSGWYLYENELPHFAGNLAQWILLPKERWIGADNYYADDIPVLSGNEMTDQCRNYIRRHTKAPMIIQVENRDGFTVGVSRGFVVRDAWPHF